MKSLIKKIWIDLIVFIKQNKMLFLTLIYAAVLLDALVVSVRSDLITFTLLGLYVFLINVYSLKSKNAFSFCLVLLLVMYSNILLIGPEFHTEKVAVWLVLFMAVGIIKQWRE